MGGRETGRPRALALEEKSGGGRHQTQQSGGPGHHSQSVLRLGEMEKELVHLCWLLIAARSLFELRLIARHLHHSVLLLQ